MATQTTESSLDELAKELATGTLSRGKAIRWMGGALLGAALASVAGVAWANDCRRLGRECRRDSQCCSRNCFGRRDDKVCGCRADQTLCKKPRGEGRCVNLQTNERHCGECFNRCPEGQECVNGVCDGNPCSVGVLVTPVDGGAPFCAGIQNCRGSCTECSEGTICATGGSCDPAVFPVTCALPCS